MNVPPESTATVCRPGWKMLWGAWAFCSLMLTVWWQNRRVRHAFGRVRALPRDEAMRVVTRWRWELTREGAAVPADPRLRDAYLLAVERLGEQVEADHAARERIIADAISA